MGRRQRRISRESYESYILKLGIEGAPRDIRHDETQSSSKSSSKSSACPVLWDETFEFIVAEPDVAMLTLEVVLADSVVAHSAHPVQILRHGVRFIPLWGPRHEELQKCGVVADIEKWEVSALA